MQVQAKDRNPQSPRPVVKPARFKRKPSPLIDSAEQFAMLARPANKDIRKFKELFYTLIFQSDSAVRKKLVTVLCRNHYVPRTIALFFAMDDISIASPMLLFSPVLSSTDLNTLVKRNQLTHSRVIARRCDLDVSTVKVLLGTNDQQGLIRTLLNKNVSLANNQAVQDLLKLPASAFKPAGEEIKPQDITVSVLEDELPKLAESSKNATAKLVDLANKGGRITAQRKNLSGFYAETTEQFEKQLLDSARKGNHEALGYSIESFCDLKMEKTLDIITKQDAGMLACLFSAMGISKMASSQLLLLLNKQVGGSITVFRKVMAEFDQLHRSECQALFEYMGAKFSNSFSHQRDQKQELNFNQKLVDRRRNLTTSSLTKPKADIAGTLANVG